MKPLPNPVRTGPSWAESGRASIWIAAVLALVLAGAAFFGISSATNSLGVEREAEAFARNLSVLATSTHTESIAAAGPTPGTELNASAALVGLEPALIALERSDSSASTKTIRASYDQLASEAAAAELAIMTGQKTADEVNAALAVTNQAFLTATNNGYNELQNAVATGKRWFTVFTGAIFAIVGLLLSGLILHSNSKSVAAASARQRQETRFRALMQHSSDIISLINPKGEVDAQSSSVLRLLGRSDLWITGRPFIEIVNQQDHAKFTDLLQRAHSKRGEAVHTRLHLSHGDGSVRLFDVTAADQIDQPEIEGTLLTCKVIGADLVDSRPAGPVLQIQHPMSGLLTEPFFRDRLQHALTRSTRTAAPLTLVLLDLAPAEAISALSDDARSAVLRTVAGRLMRSIRSGDSIAHLRDFEMAIILEDADLTFAKSVVNRIESQVVVPISHLNGQIQLAVRTGLTVKSDPRDNPDTMLLEARAAVQRATLIAHQMPVPASVIPAAPFVPTVTVKKPVEVVLTPEPPKQLFETFVSRAVTGGTSIERMVEIAAEDAASVAPIPAKPEVRKLNASSYEIQFIPVLALETGEIVELETQIRWRHPERGFVPVELSADADLVAPWALESACRIARSLPVTRAGNRIRMSVNISPSTPIDETLVDTTAKVLLTSGIDPTSLQLEFPARRLDQGDQISESVRSTLRQLRELGVRLAIDGAGAEAGRLPDFHNLPVQSVKLDRSVVMLLDRSADRRAIVREIVELAQASDVVVIGTGVETLEQAERLWDLGANEGQGPLFFRPIPEDQLSTLFPTLANLVAAD